jgi:hypothetical protein
MSFSQLAILKSSSLFLVTLMLSGVAPAQSMSTGLGSFSNVELLADRAPSSETSDSFINRLNLNGSFRAGYWNRDKSFSDRRDFGVGSAWITLRPEEILGTKILLDGFVQGQDQSRDNYSRGDLREGYIEKSFGALDVKIGRQIIVWGRADKANPTDSFSSKDLTMLVTDDEDQRLGQMATQLVYNFESIRLISIWQSEWRPSIFPLQAVPGVSFEALRPVNSQNQFGLKLDSSGGEMDWSISYYDGFNRTPDLKVIEMGAGGIKLGLDYSPIQVYGADFAKTVGQYGIRAEAAFTKTQDSDGKNPLQQNASVFAVAGADRTLVENFNLNFQLMFKSIMDYQDPDSISDVNTRLLAENVARISNQKYKEQFGFTLRPSYKLYNDTLELEVAYVAWHRSEDYLVRPKITYAFSDTIKGTVGGEFYNGPADTLLGQLKDTSSLFTELRWHF